MKNFNSFINKNKFSDLNIGDRVVCLKGIMDGVQMEGCCGIITDVIKGANGYFNHEQIFGNGYRISFDEPLSNYRTSWFVFDQIVIPENPEEYKRRKEEIKRKKEQIKLKHMEIDPFCEEEWDE